MLAESELAQKPPDVIRSDRCFSATAIIPNNGDVGIYWKNPKKINFGDSDPGQCLAGAISSLSQQRNATLLMDLTLSSYISPLRQQDGFEFLGVCAPCKMYEQHTANIYMLQQAKPFLPQAPLVHRRKFPAKTHQIPWTHLPPLPCRVRLLVVINQRCFSLCFPLLLPITGYLTVVSLLSSAE